MARILYGVHGTGHGHAMRGLTIARALPRHEFLFIANDDAPAVLEKEFQVRRLPNLGTAFKNYKVDFPATMKKALPLLLGRERHIRRAQEIIDEFKPDVCMADLEYFTPRAAKRAGLPCLTLDHQHIMTCFRHALPARERREIFIQGLSPRFLFPPTDYNLIISFYSPPPLPKYSARTAPPILREKLLRMRPADEGHILVYQSNSTDRALVDFLKKSGRRAYVFGMGEEASVSGNVHFRPKSEEEFLELLCGAGYVIQGGSHTLMGEALYLGKPVLSLPIKSMAEQTLNAFYLERLGYGQRARMEDLGPAFLDKFEERLPVFRKNIAAGDFLGNDKVFGLVDFFARKGRLPEKEAGAGSSA